MVKENFNIAAAVVSDNHSERFTDFDLLSAFQVDPSILSNPAKPFAGSRASDLPASQCIPRNVRPSVGEHSIILGLCLSSGGGVYCLTPFRLTGNGYLKGEYIHSGYMVMVFDIASHFASWLGDRRIRNHPDPPAVLAFSRTRTAVCRAGIRGASGS